MQIKQMNEIELKFRRFAEFSDYYTVWYREKNFVPKEIEPKNIFRKFLKKIFGIRKFTNNNWKPIMHFCYAYIDKWILIGKHPKGHWQQLMYSYANIKDAKQKFKTLEDIENYNKKQHEHYEKMVKLHLKQEARLKNEIE